MRHRKKGRRLGRFSSEKNALMRNLLTSLFKYDSVITTEAKAKELIPVAEKIISIARKQDINAIRRVSGIIYEKEVASKIFSSTDLFSKESGHFHVYKLGVRQGDGAPLVKVALIK